MVQEEHILHGSSAQTFRGRSVLLVRLWETFLTWTGNFKLPTPGFEASRGLFLRSPTLPTEPQNLEENSMGKLESLISFVYKCQKLSDATSRPP